MFEVLTPRIAHQHIMLQAIGAGLFNFQRKRRREVIHSVIFSAVRSARIVACASCDLPGAGPLIIHVNPLPLSACAARELSDDRIFLYWSLPAHSRICEQARFLNRRMSHEQGFQNAHVIVSWNYARLDVVGTESQMRAQNRSTLIARSPLHMGRSPFPRLGLAEISLP
ncbi:hypothetical protein [Bradyrhizobium tropiciagri]|uniref:hypothetical protein n=1 Tax=Bradyrhizobium tropiciagri TaxID=312253 RepID=UPI00067BBF61|nr:hypothetical protein [Bradyrhizobium tropiciagri]